MTPESNISQRVENLPTLVDTSNGFAISLKPYKIPTLEWITMFEPADWVADGQECFLVIKEGVHGEFVYHVYPSLGETVGQIYLTAAENQAGYRLDLLNFGSGIEVYKRKALEDGFAGSLWLMDKGEIRLVEKDSAANPFLKTTSDIVLLPVIFKVPQGIIVTTKEEITKPAILNFLKRFFNDLERLPDERRPRFAIPPPEW